MFELGKRILGILGAGESSSAGESSNADEIPDDEKIAMDDTEGTPLTGGDSSCSACKRAGGCCTFHAEIPRIR
jgi:hypothetical protein